MTEAARLSSLFLKSLHPRITDAFLPIRLVNGVPVGEDGESLSHGVFFGYRAVEKASGCPKAFGVVLLSIRMRRLSD